VTRAASYLLAGQPTELERLQLQSRVWEAAGRALLAQLPGGSGRRALDVGCGVLGWLRVLSEWVGPLGRVIGSDIDDKMLAGARSFVEAEALGNVALSVYRRLVKPGGWIVLEDPDMASWRVNPDAPAVQRLIDLIKEGFRAAGGDFNAGRELPSLFGSLGVEPRLDARRGTTFTLIQAYASLSA
jgi:SAM-dependent methyltransferase